MANQAGDAGADLDPTHPIPLFPLPNVVLFPSMPFPLHVFEPRYRKMVEDLLAAEPRRRLIGICLLRPGWQENYYGRPAVFETGCAGRLEQCRPAAGGRFDIVLRGLVRFRILEEKAGEPYRRAHVEPCPDPPAEGPDLERARRRVLAAIGRAADGPAVLVLQKELPYDVFINALCQSLPLDPLERQSLLECASIPARYERLLQILDFKQLEQTYGRPADGPRH
jgi:Lon protease-like protein